MNINKIIKVFKKVNLLKTLYFNFHYFPFKIAVRLPVFIFWRSELYKMKGTILINAHISTGMLKFGCHGLGTQDLFYSRTMWEVYGTLILDGKANIGRGSKISIGEDATLILGKNFSITGNSTIISQKEITFGSDCLLSWDILIMDTDFHHIMDKDYNKINNPEAIKIGKHVWIGCRNTILKGVSIADNTVISANSIITRSFFEENCVIGGHGKNVNVIKKDIIWSI